MKRFAKIAAVVLGMSTVAAAQPWYNNEPVPHHRTQRDNGWRQGNDRPYDRPYDRGYQGTRHEFWHQGRDYGWMNLGTLRAARGRQFLDLGNGQRASQLMVQGDRGAPYIDSVLVHFANGDTERFAIHQRLRPGESVPIDLERSRIVRGVTVFAAPDRFSTFTIMSER